MSHFEIIVVIAALIAVVLAILAFIKTPDEQKFGFPKHVKKEGVEYAPEYNTREKWRQILLVLIWVIPFFLVANYLWFPWFNQYVQYAYCDKYGSFTGFHIVAYSLFVAVPIGFAAVLFAFMGSKFIKILRVGQFPLPGEKVLRPTKYIYGSRARLIGILFFMVLISLVGLGVWGYFAANELVLSFESKWPDCPNS